MNKALLTLCRQATELAASALLGAQLVSDTPEGRVAGRIVEVEAYGGAADGGSHISRAVTERTKIMAGRPGLAYVYLIYGMHQKRVNSPVHKSDNHWRICVCWSFFVVHIILCT